MVDLFEKELKLKLDKKTILYNLHNRKRSKIYEYDEWIDCELYKFVDITEYAVANTSDISEMYELVADNELLSEKELQELKYEDKRYKLSICYFKYLQSILVEKYDVELFKEFNSVLGNTKVYFYIKELNAVIISSEFTKDDILNLALIPGLRILIWNVDSLDESWESYLCLFELVAMKGLESQFKAQLKIVERATNSAKKRSALITPNFTIDKYLSLNDKSKLIEFYNTLSEDKKRSLKALNITSKGRKAIDLVNSVAGRLIDIADKILPLELMLKSILNIKLYEDENKEIIDKDIQTNRNVKFLMTHYYYQNNFTEYKLLVKEFDKRFNELYKWLSQFFRIIGDNLAADYEDNGINEDTIYYKIVMEIKERLSRIWFVSEVILFGSVARGQEKEGSDIDIAYKIGIDAKDLTPSKRQSLHNIVAAEIEEIENKFIEIVPGYPKITFLTTKGGLKIPEEHKLINLLALSFHNKKQIKNYENTMFFNGSKVLFSRDKFEFSISNYKELIAYKDIKYVVVPTLAFNCGQGTYIVQNLTSESNPIFRFTKFDYEENEYKASGVYIAYNNAPNGNDVETNGQLMLSRRWNSTIVYKRINNVIYDMWPTDTDKSINMLIKNKEKAKVYMEEVNDFNDCFLWTLEKLGLSKV